MADRRSFQTSLGLTNGASIPEESTICRYRKCLPNISLIRNCFNPLTASSKKQVLSCRKALLLMPV